LPRFSWVPLSKSAASAGLGLVFEGTLERLIAPGKSYIGIDPVCFFFWGGSAPASPGGTFSPRGQEELQPVTRNEADRTISHWQAKLVSPTVPGDFASWVGPNKENEQVTLR